MNEVVVNGHVATVPDKCDRIVWRGRYFGLPILLQDQHTRMAKLFREALRGVTRDCTAWNRDAQKLLDEIDSGHHYHDRTDGLAHCRICGGGEGSLPTNCPGEKMHHTLEDAVMAGTLDYKNGMWIVTNK